MATTAITDQVTVIPAAWGKDVDTATYNYLTSVAGTNTVTATGPANLTAYAAGQKWRWIPAATNTGATTLNITPTGGAALGARNIFYGGVACTGGEMTIGVPCEATDDGTQLNLTSAAAIGRTIVRRKTADESVTSSVTLQDDDHLTFPIAANEEYQVDYFLSALGAVSMNHKFAVDAPSGAVIELVLFGGFTSGGATQWSSARTTSIGTALTTGQISGASAGVLLSLWVLNGATPGSITLQFAQDTSAGSSSTLKKGSHLRAVRNA